ncbi:MAG: hypothetical protein F9K30_03695 [Dechloromonas sp.]|nr:MAG: hypothetical protein F9K30_03695 [Dechloromonas sp.]
MHWLVLPDPRKNITPAFQDVPGARHWLAQQPQAQPLQTLAALCLQVEALDSGTLSHSLVIDLLALLRTAAVPLQENIEPRFVRKPLPLSDEERRIFELAVRFWLRLAIAYLRRLPELPPDARNLPLNRAACALRMAAYCHFQAAYECPLSLDRLLFGVLATAQADGLLEQAIADPDFRHLGESTTGGHLAWAFLLRLIDPYRLTSSQLTVTNRAMSRWRELTSFSMIPDTDSRAQNLDLSPLYGGQLPPGMPRWLAIRSVVRKIRQRLDALRQGESPESLKLGRELSAAACIRLLEEISGSLEAHERDVAPGRGEIALAFGGEHAYALLRGEYLNSPESLDANSASLAHQRMALFGFDRVSQVATAVKRIEVPSETWTMIDGMVIRAAGQQVSRRISPCLVAANVEGSPRLGVLFGLQVTAGDVLTGGLYWYDGVVEAGWLKRTDPLDRGAPRTPVFLIREGDELSLILPASVGARLGVGIAIDGTSLEHLQPREVLERGVDFVRYACRSG